MFEAATRPTEYVEIKNKVKHAAEYSDALLIELGKVFVEKSYFTELIKYAINVKGYTKQIGMYFVNNIKNALDSNALDYNIPDDNTIANIFMFLRPLCVSEINRLIREDDNGKFKLLGEDKNTWTMIQETEDNNNYVKNFLLNDINVFKEGLSRSFFALTADPYVIYTIVTTVIDNLRPTYHREELCIYIQNLLAYRDEIELKSNISQLDLNQAYVNALDSFNATDDIIKKITKEKQLQMLSPKWFLSAGISASEPLSSARNISYLLIQVLLNEKKINAEEKWNFIKLVRSCKSDEQVNEKNSYMVMQICQQYFYEYSNKLVELKSEIDNQMMTLNNIDQQCSIQYCKSFPNVDIELAVYREEYNVFIALIKRVTAEMLQIKSSISHLFKVLINLNFDANTLEQLTQINKEIVAKLEEIEQLSVEAKELHGNILALSEKVDDKTTNELLSWFALFSTIEEKDRYFHIRIDHVTTILKRPKEFSAEIKEFYSLSKTNKDEKIIEFKKKLEELHRAVAELTYLNRELNCNILRNHSLISIINTVSGNEITNFAPIRILSSVAFDTGYFTNLGKKLNILKKYTDCCIKETERIIAIYGRNQYQKPSLTMKSKARGFFDKESTENEDSDSKPATRSRRLSFP